MVVRTLFRVFGGRAGLSVTDFCHPGSKSVTKNVTGAYPQGVVSALSY